VGLKKVAQFLIKGSILTSKASPFFTILLIVKIDSNSIKDHALLNSRAPTYFIDKAFVDHHKLPLITKKHHFLVKIIDGRLVVSRDIIHEITLLDIILKGYHSIIAFNVINL
jgi:hypothetical protein